MLEFKEIKKHYSIAEQNLPQLILKEYLQYKILEIIFSSKYGDRLVFMGGTAIRIVYGSDRFSEDLDLDNLDLSREEFADLMEHIKRELEAEGLVVEFRNSFQNVYHCYLKFPRILFSNNLSPLKDEKIMIRVDSFRVGKSVGNVENNIISKAGIFSEIKVYSSAVLLSQKIEALFNRQRSKGRDIYDIIYLFPLTEPDYGYLKNNKLGIDQKKELFTEMKKLFSDKELVSLARDVKPFLINSKKVKQVEKFNLWLSSNSIFN